MYPVLAFISASVSSPPSVPAAAEAPLTADSAGVTSALEDAAGSLLDAVSGLFEKSNNQQKKSMTVKATTTSLSICKHITQNQLGAKSDYQRCIYVYMRRQLENRFKVFTNLADVLSAFLY